MTKKHRRHSTAKKREVAEDYFNGESMRALSYRLHSSPKSGHALQYAQG